MPPATGARVAPSTHARRLPGPGVRPMHPTCARCCSMLRAARCAPPSCRCRPAAQDEVLVEVRACGVCRTDLHVIDGELPDPKLPLVLGHEIVGTVERARRRRCAMSRSATASASPGSAGRAGGAASASAAPRTSARRRASPAINSTAATPSTPSPTRASRSRCPGTCRTSRRAPLLCAGLIGYRTLRMAGDAERLGIYGFGAAAHLVAQVARHQGRRVFAFTRPGDAAAQAFARELGAVWAGDSTSAAARAARCRPHLRAGRRAGADRAARRGAGRRRGLRRHPHERRSRPSPTSSCGASAWCAPWPTSPGATARSSCRVAATQHPYARSPRATRSTRANDALDDLRHGRFTGAAVLIPAVDALPGPG